MKRDYQSPYLSVEDVKVEAGFATSYVTGTPGGDIGFNDYGDEL